MKYWEIIADNLSKAGWSWGWISAVDCNGRTIFVAHAHRDDGKRFVARSDEKLMAFVELEALVRNETCKAGKLGQPLLPLREMRQASGQARIAGRDIPRDKSQG
jgi:hypothetical protein